MGKESSRADRVNAKEREKMNIQKGIELAKRLGPPMYADLSELSEKEEELYRDGYDALNRAYQLKEILGEVISPEAAAKVFTEFSEQLCAAIKSRDKKTEQEIDEKLVKIASAYGLSVYGLGNVLAQVSGRLGEGRYIEMYAKKIAENQLTPGIRIALEYL